MKVILWDFDGTLANRDGMWTGTLVSIVNRRLPDRQVTRESVRPFLHNGFPWHTPEITHPGQNADEWWSALKPVFIRAYEGIGIAPAIANDLADEVQATYLDASCWQVFDDVIPCLNALSRVGWTHCIMSNHVPELPDLVRSLGLSQFFDQIITSAKTGYEKPHLEAFKGVIGTFPRGSTFWMVGDSLSADVHGAQAVGISAILARTKQVGVKFYGETLYEVVEIIRTNKSI
jgi:putative hydrolase of the HAD superfamily